MLQSSTFKAVVNNKQVISSNLDFPKVDKIQKYDIACLFKHFCGQCSTFIIFKDSLSCDKLKKIYAQYPFGLYEQSTVNSLNESSIFDSKVISRIELVYTPVRSTPNVGVWDLIGNHFGTLEANSGIWVEDDFKDQFEF